MGESWKRLAVIAWLGGFAFAIALGASVLWYIKRPESWDRTAIQATYIRATFLPQGGPYPGIPEREETEVILEFNLRNTTDSDYTLERKSSETLVMEKLRGKDSLMMERDVGENLGSGVGVTWDSPIFIPAGHTVQVSFSRKFDMVDIVAALGDERFRTSPYDQSQEKRVFRDSFKDTTSLILFDKRKRILIELPLLDALKD